MTAAGLSNALNYAGTARRDLILDSAMAIASNGGYDAVKMRTVADGAGIAVGTLYRHFRSKPHVLVVLLAREFERIGAERDWATSADSPRLRVEQLNARLHVEWRAKPALTEAVTRAFVLADSSTSADVDHAAAVIERLLGVAIAGGEPDSRQNRLAAVIVDIWLASLIAWVGHSTTAEEIGVRLDRTIGLVLADEN